MAAEMPDFDVNEPNADVFDSAEYLPPPEREGHVPTSEEEANRPNMREWVDERGVLVRTYFPAAGSTPPPPEAPAVAPSPPPGPAPTVHEANGTKSAHVEEPPRMVMSELPPEEPQPEKTQQPPAPELPPEKPTRVARPPEADKTRPHVATVSLPADSEPDPLKRGVDDVTPQEDPKRRGCLLGRLLLILPFMALVAAVGWFALYGGGFENLFTVRGALPAGTSVIGEDLPTPEVTRIATETAENGAGDEQDSDSPTAAPEVLPSPTPLDPMEDEMGVPMVFVPGGTFLMGANDGVNGPVHEVTLSAFTIDMTEVTNVQWAECVEEGDCPEPGTTTDFAGEPYYGEEDFADYPVIFIAWEDAANYCQWRGARLPTEAEWEMAARWDPITGQVSDYPWGDEPDPALANICDGGCPLPGLGDVTDGFAQTAPVGSFSEGASAVGALDMAGNVAEWVADWYAPYSGTPQEDPTGPENGTRKVVRGGAWGVSLLDTRTFVRSRFAPDSQSAGLGFRCVVEDTP